jgi:muramoyltetrapeptide carboxypeptidase
MITSKQPERLKKGDEIRVVAPSMSLSLYTKKEIKDATAALTKLGFQVTFGKNVYEVDDFSSSSVSSRVEDLHEAFADPAVKMVMAVTGGFSVNQIFRELDWDLIAKNPKILTGYSDTTALQNAIYAKTGVITFSGPLFDNFTELKNHDYTVEYFLKCAMESGEFEVKPSKLWDDRDALEDGLDFPTLKNTGTWNIQPGKAEGVIIGGNLCTLNLLQGTEYMPSLDQDVILFLEDDHEGKSVNFDRDLVSLIHQPGFKNVKGVVIGRFQSDSETTKKLVKQMILTKPELEGIPVIANADFGHTNPFFTIPIGGKCRIDDGNIFLEW